MVRVFYSGRRKYFLRHKYEYIPRSNLLTFEVLIHNLTLEGHLEFNLTLLLKIRLAVPFAFRTMSFVKSLYPRGFKSTLKVSK